MTKSLYGSSILERTEVDHWLTFSLGPLACPGETEKSLSYLDSVLQPATFLVGDSVTIADYEVYGRLANMPVWLWLVNKQQEVARQPPALVHHDELQAGGEDCHGRAAAGGES